MYVNMRPYIINMDSPYGVLKCNNLKQVDQALRIICRNGYFIHSLVEIDYFDTYIVVYEFDMDIQDRRIIGRDLFSFIDTVNDEGGHIKWIIRARA